MDEISIRIENIPEELDPISIHEADEDVYEGPVERPLIRHRSNSPLTISDNGSSDSDSNDELRLIRKDHFLSRIDSEYKITGNSNPDFERFKKKSFDQVEQSLAKYYQTDNKYYDKLDILITFTKGQKTLFSQSAFITQKKVYLLMFPVVFFSAAMAIFAPIIQDYGWSGGLISGLNVLVTFFVSMMNYMKFESRAEIYSKLANHYDKLEMSLEMTSNKTSYIQNTGEKNALILEKLKEIEININELKDIYDVILPQEVVRICPIICNINVFSLIKKMESYRRVLIYKFKDIKNEIGYILHKWKHDSREGLVRSEPDQQKEKDRLLFLYDIKEKIKCELLEFVNIYQYVDEVFSKEIRTASENRGLVNLFFKRPRQIKKEDIHPVLQRYFSFLFE
jgi:hypothetical protein